jgi:hypothetical protein
VLIVETIAKIRIRYHVKASRLSRSQENLDYRETPYVRAQSSRGLRGSASVGSALIYPMFTQNNGAVEEDGYSSSSEDEPNIPDDELPSSEGEISLDSFEYSDDEQAPV